MIKVIAVDSGKYATKSIYCDSQNGVSRQMFRTKMDLTNELASGDKQSMVVEWEGERYLLGEQAEGMNFDKSKALLIHKLATYASVAQYVKNGDHVAIVSGAPLSVYTNVEERKRYQAFMEGEKEIHLMVNNQPVHFIIDFVVVCPESSGIIYHRVKELKDRLIGVVDIGGLNTNCSVYNRLNPIKSTAFTTNLGANVLANELKQLLNSQFPEANLQDWQMEDIIKKGYMKSHKEASRTVIQGFLQMHIKKVVEEMTKKGWDIKNIDLLFVGGGSLLLQTEIKNLIEDAEVVEEAEWANVEGFLKVGIASAKKR